MATTTKEYEVKKKSNLKPGKSLYEDTEENIAWWKIWKHRRYQIAVLALFGFFNIYSLRTNLSIAIVAMTENRSVLLENGTTIYEQEFAWSSTQQGVILSSFFYGYITTQVLGGFVSERYGGQKFFGLGIFITAALTLLTPVVAKYSYEGLITLRVIEGIFEGVTYPSIHAVWARWAPPLERSRLTTIGYSGSYIGTVAAMTIGGVIAEEWGWESIFYFFGAIGVFWFICWWILVYENPNEDKFISQRELKYILTSLEKENEKKLNVKHPWKKILTSLPVWAIIFSHFCENWGFYTLLTQLPRFMREMLNFDISSSGILSALPYVAMSICTVLSGFLADLLLSKNWLTTTQVRKSFNCSAFLSQTVFMLAAGFLLERVGSTICLTFAVGLGGLALSGFGVNYLDIGPSHASVIMGISNTFATIPGMVSPTLTGILVPNNTEAEWRNIFYISAGIYLIGCTFYGTCASGELQEWSWDAKMKREKGVENEGYVPDENDKSV
ncbi:sialin [Agrilus planipennis]|uniref:Sialin n=1 Tax=Agrilus planipennis TaxID=224129 RepID=A0A7F5RAN3_AGRPL|nr:sialin [Agrilus planipennis]